jgi:polar amino acid transport system substrate-binding protein
MTIKMLLAAICLGARCATSVAAGVVGNAAPFTLYIGTEASAPYSMREGERVSGIGTDTVREIMTRSGIDYTIELLPWKRAYATALARSNGCVFSTTRTPERETLFKWVGPIGEADWVLMGRADRNLSLRTLEDARPYLIGTYNGDAREAYLRERGFHVDSAPNDFINPRKLVAGRIDLWAASVRSSGPTLRRLGYTDRIVPVLVFNRIRVYLACNRAIPDALVARMNGAMAAMERDGSARAIRQRYDDWGLPPRR